MKNRSWLSFLMALVFLTGCNTTPVNHPAKIKAVTAIDLTTLSEADQKLFFQSKLMAESAIRQQRYDLAASNFLIAAELSHSGKLAQKAVFAAESYEDSLTSYQAATLWATLEPGNQIAFAWKAIGEIRSHQSKNLQMTLEKLYQISDGSNNNSFIGISEQIINRVANEWTLKNFSQFAQQHSKDPQVWLVLAKLEEKMSNIDEAIAYVDKALSLKPDNNFALEEKGLIYQRSGQNQKALDYFSSMEKKFPEAYSLKLQLAQIYFQKGQNKLAQNLLEKLLSIQPERTFARYLLAASYLSTENIKASEKQFIFLLERNYKPDMVNYFLGEIHLKKKEPELAIQFFQAVKQGNYLTRARISAARILFDNKRYQQAFQQLHNVPTTNLGEQIFLASTEIEMMRKAKLLDKNIAGMWNSFKSKPTNIYLFTRALLTAKSQKDRESMIQFALNSTKSLAVTKALIETATEINQRLGENQQAIKLLNEFLERMPNDVKLRYNRAMLYAAEGKTNKMETDLRYILRVDPNHIDALNALGYSLADENKDLDKAYKMIMEAYRNRPGSAAITDSLGWVLFRKGQLKEASEHLKQAWDLSPSADIGAHLGEVLWQSGKKEQAKMVWRKAKNLDANNSVLVETLKRFKQ